MSEDIWRNPIRTLRTPEWVAALYLFLLHFVWEMLQTPFFAEMQTMPHWPATLFCLKATIGDVMIGVTAFCTAALMQRDRGWFLSPTRRALITFIAIGVAAAIGLELHAIAQGRWSYSALMPIVPSLNVGLIPILQWLILPWPLLLLLRRHHVGARQLW